MSNTQLTRWLVFCLGASLLALLAACGGAGTASKSGPGSWVSGETSPVDLDSGLLKVRMRPEQPVELGHGDPALRAISFAAPPSLLSQLPAPKSASFAPGDLVKDGATYDPALPNNKVAPSSASVLLQPTWDGATPDIANLAYCTFAFTIDGYPASGEDQTLGLDWDADKYPTALEISDVWLGFANWAAGRWDWYPAESDNVLTLSSYTPYVDGSGRCLVMMVTLGTKELLLDQLTIGAPELRGTGEVPSGEIQPVDRTPALDGSGSLPSSVDLHGACSPVRDQGGLGSCTAFATAGGAFDYVLNVAYRGCWDYSYANNLSSTRYLYVNTGSDCSGGRDTWSVMNYVKNSGTATEQTAPYGNGKSSEFQCGGFSGEANADAALLRASSAHWWSSTLDDADLADMKNVLANMKIPLVMRTQLDGNFGGLDEGEVWTYNGTSIGGHAMCIVGYDDGKGAFLVRNSWGDDWCDKGYCWISYNSMKQANSSAAAGYLTADFNMATAQHFCNEFPTVAPPSNLNASDGDFVDKVRITWNSNSTYDSLALYRDTQDNKVADIAGGVTSYDDLSAGIGNSHIYWLKAKFGGFESPFSAPDPGYQAADPFILEVWPVSGNSNSYLLPRATVVGTGPFTYSWDFGSGAVPPTSTDEEPIVTLASQGNYPASLTVSGPNGSDTYDFTLVVDFEESEWTHTFGGSDREQVNAITTDAAGNVYAVGTIGIAAGTNDDVLTAKYSRGGQLLWVKRWASDGAIMDTGSGIAVAATGEVYVVGNTQYDALLLKYGGDGTFYWARKWEDGGYEFANGVALTSDRIFAVGSTSTTPNGGTDPTLLAWDFDGNSQLKKYAGGSGFEALDDIAFNGTDTLYACGTTEAGAGGGDLLLMSWSTTGAVNWAKAWGGGQTDNESHMVYDALNDRIYLSGTCENFIGASDNTLVRFQPDGNTVWQRAWNNESGETTYNRGVAVDPAGNVYLVGLYDDQVSDLWYHFLLQYNSDGNLQFERKRQDDATEKLLCITGNNTGKLLLGGYANQADSFAWLPIGNGNPQSVNGTLTNLTWSSGDCSGLAGEAVNSDITPTGTADTGGGDKDLEIINYNPLQ